MQLTNDFQVALQVEDAWRVLTDLERVGPCLPGASITGRDGENYLGQAKIKVGPITANYKGTARFIELDETSHRAVLSAKGREARGGGDAQAMVTATLTGKGDITEVTVLTDLALSGKVAQFGRGVIVDVSQVLLTTFVDRLEAMLRAENKQDGAGADALAAPSSAADKEAGHPTPAAVRPAEAAPRGDDALDLLALARGAAAGRIPPAASYVGVAFVSLLFGWLLGRRRR